MFGAINCHYYFFHYSCLQKSQEAGPSGAHWCQDLHVRRHLNQPEVHYIHPHYFHNQHYHYMPGLDNRALNTIWVRYMLTLLALLTMLAVLRLWHACLYILSLGLECHRNMVIWLFGLYHVWAKSRMSEWMYGYWIADTPSNVMTSRAPAVLTNRRTLHHPICILYMYMYTHIYHICL